MKVFSLKMENISIFVLLVIIVSGLYFTIQKQNTVETMLPVNSKVIILDAGHGGWDPGKTGTQGDNEKNINLQIAQKLKQYLEQGGAVVYMTRNSDEALGEKKGEDMKERKRIANESEGDIFISIHQNAFPKGSAKGAQVFYHKQSQEGKKLAEEIQKSLKKYVDDENIREVKENTNYYILKKTELPSALVECGFLSNLEEEKKLNTEEYQQKVAWAIYVGIMNYFEQQDIQNV
ncbi:MAG: N-acetylmuramoyl-L-alanine amidase CwlD [Firmicutes bacterium]|jgi:N-acetylmuramoyl-L-alanine amidase|nr:N-acetylmuramoyl-L-alanine amidase CwlD [Bacillota bacterium]